MPGRRWVYVRAGSDERLDAKEKARIATACEKLIAEVLLPRYLPRIEPSEFNYPVGIHGKWHGRNYRFMVRYRSGFPDNRGQEFDAPFARLEFVKRDVFDLSYHRHTGQWWPFYGGCTLKKALQLIAAEGPLRPPI